MGEVHSVEPVNSGQRLRNMSGLGTHAGGKRALGGKAVSMRGKGKAGGGKRPVSCKQRFARLPGGSEALRLTNLLLSQLNKQGRGGKRKRQAFDAVMRQIPPHVVKAESAAYFALDGVHFPSVRLSKQDCELMQDKAASHPAPGTMIEVRTWNPSAGEYEWDAAKVYNANGPNDQLDVQQYAMLREVGGASLMAFALQGETEAERSSRRCLNELNVVRLQLGWDSMPKESTFLACIGLTYACPLDLSGQVDGGELSSVLGEADEWRVVPDEEQAAARARWDETVEQQRPLVYQWLMTGLRCMARATQSPPYTKAPLDKRVRAFAEQALETPLFSSVWTALLQGEGLQAVVAKSSTQLVESFGLLFLELGHYLWFVEQQMQRSATCMSIGNAVLDALGLPPMEDEDIATAMTYLNDFDTSFPPPTESMADLSAFLNVRVDTC